MSFIHQFYHPQSQSVRHWRHCQIYYKRYIAELVLTRASQVNFMSVSRCSTVSLFILLFNWYRLDIFETDVKRISDNYLGRPVTPKITTFGDVTPCRMVENYWCFGGMCYLHPLSRKIGLLLNMDAAIFSELWQIRVWLLRYVIEEDVFSLAWILSC
jgi:hypothetical protein